MQVAESADTCIGSVLKLIMRRSIDIIEGSGFK